LLSNSDYADDLCAAAGRITAPTAAAVFAHFITADRTWSAGGSSRIYFALLALAMRPKDNGPATDISVFAGQAQASACRQCGGSEVRIIFAASSPCGLLN
jgi:hypothetical protein